ncbi:hypothetical protein ACFOES_20495, partial [Acidimangrovimonas pyrenivorans]
MSTDYVYEGTDTRTSLAVGTTKSGVIDAEPISGDGVTLDNSGGYVDKDWYRVSLLKGHVYEFDGHSLSLSTGSIAISLYDANGSPVLGLQEGANPVLTIDTTSQSSSSQTYYVAVSAGGPEPDWRTATGSFSLGLADNGYTLAPTLSSVSPTSYPADNVNHTMRLLGSNFVSGDTLTFVDPQGTTIQSTSAKLTFVSGSEIDYQLNDAADAGTWQVRVNSSDGTQHSSYDAFSVAAAPQTTDNALDTVSSTANLTMDGTTIGTIDAIPISGSYDTTVDHDWFKVILSAGHDYHFSAQPTAATLDTVAIDLRDGNGLVQTPIPEGSAPDFYYTPQTSGTYYFAISAGGSDYASKTGGYQINVSDGGLISTDANDSVAGDTSTTLSLSPGQTLTGAINQTDLSGSVVDHDWYRLSLTGGQSYHFTDQGLSGTLDYTAIRIHDGNGNPLGTLADFSSSLDFAAPTSGTYYLAVSAGGSGYADKVGDYSVTMTSLGTSLSDDFADSATDTSVAIGALAVDSSKTGYIGPADSNDTYGDKDVFQVSLQQGHSYDIELKSAAVSGATLPLGVFTVRDPGNFDHVLKTSAISPDSHLIYTPDSSGTYFLRVGSGGAATDQGGYEVSVHDVTQPASAADDYPDFPGDVTASNSIATVPMGGAETGVIEAAGDKDVFKINVQSGHSYQLSLTGEGAGILGALSSTYLTVRDGASFNSEIAHGGTGLQTTLNFTAQADGIEYIRVGSGGGGTSTGGYRLSVADIGVLSQTPLSPPAQTPDPVADAVNYAEYMVKDLSVNVADMLVDDKVWKEFAGYMLFVENDAEAYAFAKDVADSGALDWIGVGAHVFSAVKSAPSGEKGRAAYVSFVDGVVDAVFMAAGSETGGLFGAVGGAGLGTLIEPGVGTALGGVGGELAGSILGAGLGHTIYDHTIHQWVVSEAESAYDYVAGSSTGSSSMSTLFSAALGTSDSLAASASSSAIGLPDEASIIKLDEEWYLKTYPDAAAAVANGIAANAYAYFLTVGIDKGEQPNASQHLTRADLPFRVINNDPAVLGKSALLTQALGNYAGDGMSAAETKVVSAINGTRGAAVGLDMDAILSAIASRKAIDLVANFADSAARMAHSHQDSGWADGWSNGNVIAQQFNDAFSTIFGNSAPDSHFQLFVVAQPGANAANVIAQIEAQAGGSAALSDSNYNTIGVAEYGGIWVVIVGERDAGYTPVTPTGTDGLAHVSEYGGAADDILFAGTRQAHLYGLAGNDLLVGGASADHLSGGTGADTIKGASGADHIIGNLGADHLQGGNGFDTIFAGAGNDTVDGGNGRDKVLL